MLNAHIPCRTLGERAPLQAYPQARHTGRFYRPEWEAELLDLEQVYAYLGKGRFFRRVAQNGSVAIGGIYYYISIPNTAVGPSKSRLIPNGLCSLGTWPACRRSSRSFRVG